MLVACRSGIWYKWHKLLDQSDLMSGGAVVDRQWLSEGQEGGKNKGTRCTVCSGAPAHRNSRCICGEMVPNHGFYYVTVKV